MVGSGAAGLGAAIEARRQGVKVLFASKALTGLANCSIYSAGGFTAPFGTLTKENHFRTTIATGRYINNQRLVEVRARTDYPHQDDKNWLKHVVLTKKPEETKVDTCLVVMTKLSP